MLNGGGPSQRCDDGRRRAGTGRIPDLANRGVGVSARFAATPIPPFGTIRADTLYVVPENRFAIGVRPYDNLDPASGLR